MNHNFDVDIAMKYGVHSAILFNHLAFWIAKNEANKQNYFDGRYWTYNSREAFAKLFPYMTARQISYALEKLIKDGLVTTGNYNANPYDKTLWYAITDFGYSMLQNCKIEKTDLSNGDNENVKPIPDIKPKKKNTNDKPNIKDRFAFVSSSIETFMETFKDFEEMRKQIKKPMTEKAKALIIDKLCRISNGNGDVAIKILENSITNSWQGVFPLKGEEAKAKATNQRYCTTQTEDMTEYPF